MTVHGRAFLSGFLLVGVLAIALAAPMQVAACLCGRSDSNASDVVFTGTAVDVPGDGPFLGVAGVYRFDVDEVQKGDAGDGQVFSPSGAGGCGRVFEIGAKYLVHADLVDPEADWDGFGRPGASLATHACMEGSLLEPAPPPRALEQGWVVAGLIGLVVVAVGSGVAFAYGQRAR
jgi:hypothetical protein